MRIAGLVALRAQPLGHFEPVHPGQHHVEEDEVVFLRLRLHERLAPVFEPIDDVALLFDTRFTALANRRSSSTSNKCTCLFSPPQRLAHIEEI